MKKFNTLYEDIMKSSVYYHISPFKFDKFDVAHCGIGMGTSFWGHGLYFTDSESVIDYYFKQMKDSYKNLFKYTVKISGNIKNEFDQICIDEESGEMQSVGEVYYNLVEQFGEKQASEIMVDAHHIDGINYYTEEDGNSVVVYNDNVIEIVSVEQLA